MKKIILILTIVALSISSLFAQTEKTEFYAVRGIFSGSITGKMELILYTRDAITLVADSCSNFLWINNDADASDNTLPGAELGLVVGFYDHAGGAITIDPADGTDTIYKDGVSIGAGDELVSDGNPGDVVVLIAINDTDWISWGPGVGFNDANP